jgi:hypothetical protein
MGAQQPNDEPAGDGKVQRAADLESKSEDPDRKAAAAAAKPKKKKKKAAGGDEPKPE